MKKVLLLCATGSVMFFACQKDNNSDIFNYNTIASPNLILIFRFDSTQTRLNNLGQLAVMPSGHAAQSPVVYGMSSQYIEISQNANTPLGKGKILYNSPVTYAGGDTAIDFSKEMIRKNGEIFFSTPISTISSGTYKYLRVSLAYQNYNIQFYYNGTKTTGRLASFIGSNTYISKYRIDDSTVTLNASKKQGYWGFETSFGVLKGQAASGATTVVNPITNTSPVPAGSSIVTGAFPTPLTIPRSASADIVVIVSLSINKSFEWKDSNGNGLYEPFAGDTIVDMGIRGMIPIVQ